MSDDDDWGEAEVFEAPAAPAAASGVLTSSATAVKQEHGDLQPTQSSSSTALTATSVGPTTGASTGTSADSDKLRSLKYEKLLPEETRAHIAERVAFYAELDALERATLRALEKEKGVTTQIAAMSAQFTVGGLVDLAQLVTFAPNSELDKKRRPNVHIRVRNPHVSVQVNPSGFVSLLGGKSRSDLYAAARAVAAMIKLSGAYPEARVCSFAVNNIVLSIKRPSTIRRDLLERQLQELHIDAYSDQEVFPCVRVRLTAPSPHSVKVFRTGAFIFMGLTKISQCVASFVDLLAIIDALPKAVGEEGAGAGGAGAGGAGLDEDGVAIQETDDYTLTHIEE